MPRQRPARPSSRLSVRSPTAGPRRTLGLLLAGLLAGGLLLAPVGSEVAWARGGAGGAAVAQKLLEKGYQSLRLAEGAFFRGNNTVAARHGKEAQRYFLDALSQDPGNASAAMMGGQAAVLAGDLKAATEWERRYRQLSGRGEADPDLHFLHAFIHLLGAEVPSRALRSLQRMYSLDPRRRALERDNLWFKALNDHGRQLLEAEKYEEAMTQFKSGARIARRQGNRDREFLMKSNVGVALMRADRFIEASELYEGLIKADPKNAIWHWQLGLCLADQSKFIEAVPVYREVIRLRDTVGVPAGMTSDLRQVHLRLGNCLRHLAQRERRPGEQKKIFAEAEKEIRLYIKADPEDSVGYKWLGILLFKDLEKPYEAMPYLEKAYELAPECIDALKYLLQIHMHHPPPPDSIPKDDPVAAQKVRDAWTAVIEPWTREIEEGADRRQKLLEERKKKHGKTGCT